MGPRRDHHRRALVGNVPKVEGTDEHGRDGDESVELELLGGDREVHEYPEDETWTSFTEELEIKGTDTWVTSKTHPVVVEEVARHTLFFALEDGLDLEEEGEDERPEVDDGEHWTIVVVEDGWLDQTSVRDDDGEDDGDPPRGPTVEDVWETLATWEWGAEDTTTWDKVLEGGLEEEPGKVDDGGLLGWVGVFHDDVVEVDKEGLDAGDVPFGWTQQVTVVEMDRGPDPVDEDGQTENEESGADEATKFIGGGWLLEFLEFLTLLLGETRMVGRFKKKVKKQHRQVTDNGSEDVLEEEEEVEGTIDSDCEGNNNDHHSDSDNEGDQIEESHKPSCPPTPTLPSSSKKKIASSAKPTPSRGKKGTGRRINKPIPFNLPTMECDGNGHHDGNGESQENGQQQDDTEMGDNQPISGVEGEDGDDNTPTVPPFSMDNINKQLLIISSEVPEDDYENVMKESQEVLVILPDEEKINNNNNNTNGKNKTLTKPTSTTTKPSSTGNVKVTTGNGNNQQQHHHHHNHQQLPSERQYSQRYKYLKSNDDALHKPSYRELEENFQPPFQKPPNYIIYKEKTNEEQNEMVEYDMDSEDEEWLTEYNKSSNTIYTEDDFEAVIDRLEKETFEYKQSIGSDMFPHFSSSEAEDVCSVCFDGASDDTNQIVYCDGCDIAVHQECYGIRLIPEGHWFCQRCESPLKSKIECVLCKKSNGALKQTVDGEWSHLVCILNMPEINRIAVLGTGKDRVGPAGLFSHIPKQRFKLLCYVCRKKGGACIQCRQRSCAVAFHAYCIKKKQKSKILENPTPHIIYCKKHFSKNHKSKDPPETIKDISEDSSDDEKEEEEEVEEVEEEEEEEEEVEEEEEEEEEEVEDQEEEEEDHIVQTPTKKGRGGKIIISTPTRGRGRPPKFPSGARSPKKPATVPTTPTRGRGRPPKLTRGRGRGRGGRGARGGRGGLSLRTPTKEKTPPSPRLAAKKLQQQQQQEKQQQDESDSDKDDKVQPKVSITSMAEKTGITAKKADLISLKKALAAIKFPSATFVKSVYEFWVKKRLSRSGLPLIKRFQPSILYSLRSTLQSQDKGENTILHFKYLIHLRKDLERVRTILDIIRKREKFKRDYLTNLKQIFDLFVDTTHHYYQFQVIVDTLIDVDMFESFIHPVTEAQAPNYFSIIQNPICLTNIHNKLKLYRYDNDCDHVDDIIRTSNDFWDDLRLIYTNAQKYNNSKSVVYKSSVILQDIIKVLQEGFQNNPQISKLEIEKIINDGVTQPPLKKTPTKLLTPIKTNSATTPMVVVPKSPAKSPAKAPIKTPIKTPTKAQNEEPTTTTSTTTTTSSSDTSPSFKPLSARKKTPTNTSTTNSPSDTHTTTLAPTTPFKTPTKQSKDDDDGDDTAGRDEGIQVTVVTKESPVPSPIANFVPFTKRFKSPSSTTTTTTTSTTSTVQSSPAKDNDTTPTKPVTRAQTKQSPAKSTAKPPNNNNNNGTININSPGRRNIGRGVNGLFAQTSILNFCKLLPKNHSSTISTQQVLNNIEKKSKRK
ncbi:PHD zinc finger-containing protein [Cavenderia fasciculata]|uniref:PHD zinc finger-containing protein n=1 Tax=Cavenderia fasciculata TaxID=261658 RepID=F4QBT2_CACFS|nr:PHD zinc finger-containing protein [Cavenderia fasciculata]EGG14670.1 PHD zinc finger-containing protein [Cavenderia fasciculata]|eukprot:XP_004351178.1 PHD zinc finger-containing protein [Cavenderia fasciculata]